MKTKYNDIILLKNKKVMYNLKKVKPSKVNFSYMNLKSNLYGDTYLLLHPKDYNKILKIKNVKFSYKFLDGQLVDNDEFYESDVWVKNIYYYDTGRQLLEKLDEIKMIEFVLNDTFWLFDSYYSFIFNEFKIKFEYNNKIYKFNNIINFYKFIFKYTNKKNFKQSFGFISNEKRYKLLSQKDIEDKSKYKKAINKFNNYNDLFIKLSEYTYVKVNKKFFKEIDNLEGESLLYITEIDGEDALKVIDTYVQNNIDYKYEKPNICELYVQAISPIVIDSLESSNTDYIQYHIENRLCKINGKSIKKKSKNYFNKIIKKYFPGIDGSELYYY